MTSLTPSIVPDGCEGYLKHIILEWTVSTDNNKRYINIYERGGQIANLEFSMGSAPILKRQRGDYIDTTTLDFSIEVSSSVDEMYIEALFTSDPSKYCVEYIVGTTTVFVGFLVPEIYSAPIKGGVYDVKFTAIDGIANLKQYEWTIPDIGSFYNILADALRPLGIEPFFGAALGIKSQSNYTHFDFLKNVGVHSTILLGKTHYEVVEDILRTLNAKMTQVYGTWLIYQENALPHQYAYNWFGQDENGELDVEAEIISNTIASSSGYFYPVGHLTKELVPAKKDAIVRCKYFNNMSVFGNPTFDPLIMNSEGNGWWGSVVQSTETTPYAVIPAGGDLITYSGIEIGNNDSGFILELEGSFVSNDGSQRTLEIELSINDTWYAYLEEEIGLVRFSKLNPITTIIWTHQCNGSNETLKLPVDKIRYEGGSMKLIINNIEDVDFRITKAALYYPDIYEGESVKVNINRTWRNSIGEVELLCCDETRVQGGKTLVNINRQVLNFIYETPTDNYGSWSSAKISSCDYLEFIAKDIALENALVRNKIRGNIQDNGWGYPPFVVGVEDMNANYVCRGFSGNLLTGEYSVDLESIPTATYNNITATTTKKVITNK